jgi:hypothetical protein
MNRAERRRIDKNLKKNEAVYNISQQELDKIKQNVTETATESAMILLFSLPLRVLKEQYGWGNSKRLPEFAEHLTNAYENATDLEAEAEFVYQMTGIKFIKNE